MFDEILREINNILGADYALFFEFTPRDSSADEVIAQYHNIGVLHVETGTLQLLQGNQGMQVDTTLNLLMRIEETDNTSKRINVALNALVTAANGYLYSETGDMYKYILSFGVPKLTSTSMPFRSKLFVSYIVPINIVITQELTIGDEMEITIDGKNLEGVVSWQENPSKTLKALNDFNTNEVNNIFELKTWTFSVMVMHKFVDELHMLLLDNERNAPETIYDLVYKFKDQPEVSKRVYVSCILKGQRRKFATLELMFSLANEVTT